MKKIITISILLTLFGCTTAQRNIAAFNEKEDRWKLTFEDHFDGARNGISRGENPDCYSKTPHCLYSWSYRAECEQFKENLKDLNKCTWDVYHYYNYMDQDSKPGEGVNAFDGSKVNIKNGNLILSADRSPYKEFDCKRVLDNKFHNGESEMAKICPYLSGGVESGARHAKDDSGFYQHLGRFEIRAKISYGPGAWPALWMVPFEVQQSGVNRHCGWPHNGEIDILEYWSTERSKVFSTFHSGDCPTSTHIAKGGYKNITPEWMNQFHTYVAEWYEDKIVFKVDEEIINTVMMGELDSEFGKPFIQPDVPFHFILNLTISRAWGEHAPDPAKFPHQEMLIDYVKAYELCEEGNTSPDCVSFKTTNQTANYNSEKKESAYSELTAFPNPLRSGQEGKFKFMLKQDCDDVKLQLHSVQGQVLKDFPVKGPVKKDIVVEEKFATSQLAPTIYLLTAKYSRCGQEKNGHGNQVFKINLTQ